MNDKITVIREKCIAANPEILELKLGCEVEKLKYSEWDCGRFYVVAETAICNKHKKFDEKCYEQENGCVIHDGVEILEWTEENWWTYRLKQSEIKSLGRPVRLSDVLLAIEEVPKSYKLVLDCGGRFWEMMKPSPSNMLWNLRADDLEKQSEETISFLYELMK
jgi:hypothetical protein